MDKLTLSESIVFAQSVLNPMISMVGMFNISSLRNTLKEMKRELGYLNNAEFLGKEKLAILKQDEIEVFEKMINLFEARKKMLTRQMDLL